MGKIYIRKSLKVVLKLTNNLYHKENKKEINIIAKK